MTELRKDQNSKPHKDEPKVKITPDPKLTSTVKEDVKPDPKLKSLLTLEEKEEKSHKSKDE
ncbi:MAG: hypothetical protein KAW02_04290 [candidate division Zixibacteria bacterium]|nr:hypothetical protein [candidate division Zixibacteria bacterium]